MIRAALGVAVVLALMAGAWYFFKSTDQGKAVAEQGNRLAENVKNPPTLPPLPGWGNGNVAQPNVPAPTPEGTQPRLEQPATPQPNPAQPERLNGRETHISAGGTNERPFDPRVLEPVVQAPQAKEYTVQSGDSLWSISKKQYGSAKYIDQIAQANRLTPNKGLKIGQTLMLPPIKSNTCPVNPNERDADCEADNGTTNNTNTNTNTRTPPTQTVRATDNMPPTLNRTFRVERQH